MANYTAADIKALREATGAGMMDVKKALDEANGDSAKATEILRVKGLKGVTKREGRSASNGLVAVNTAPGEGTLVEVNCETDFVGKGAEFGKLAETVLAQAVKVKPVDAAELLASELDGVTVADLIKESIATIGEKIEVRRATTITGEKVVAYMHKTSPDLPPQIGVLVAFTGDDETTARDIAMHIAAFSPTTLSRDEIDPAIVEKERQIAEKTAKEEGRPEQALPNIVKGRVNAFFKENVLLEQPYAKDAKQTVGKVADAAGITVTAFVRFKVGV